jgi:hypothetical protein
MTTRANNLWRLLVGALVLSGGGAAPAGAGTTINPTNRQAYSANMGWLDARTDLTNGASIGMFYCTGFVYCANGGWIHLGNGPTNGFSYSNDSAKDYGVNHDGAGRLRGYAYGANMGWIAFETQGNPRLNLLTGSMDGFAYSANTGWIALSNAFAHVQTDRLEAGPDEDLDGIPDEWELANTGSLTNLQGGAADEDKDGRTDTEEYGADTDPQDPASVLKFTALIRMGSTNRMSWTVEPTRFYRLEQAQTASPVAVWTDSGLGQLPPGSGTTLTGEVPDASATTRFYRVKAIIPLRL